MIGNNPQYETSVRKKDTTFPNSWLPPPHLFPHEASQLITSSPDRALCSEGGSLYKQTHTTEDKTQAGCQNN